MLDETANVVGSSASPLSSLFSDSPYFRTHRRRANPQKQKQFPIISTCICIGIFFCILTMLELIPLIPSNNDSELSIENNVFLSHSSNKQAAEGGGSTYKRLTDIIKKRTKESEITLEEMRQSVKNAFEHAMKGYSEKAWGHDEIRPTTNATNDSWGGFGAVMIDALDTMWLMGCNSTFERAIQHVTSLNFNKDYDASFFETSIRYLGGLLSAYDLSGRKVLLDKALDLGERLSHAYHKDRLPFSVVNLKTKKSHNYGWTGGSSILAEFGSVQLEFKRLAVATGEQRFYDIAEDIMNMIENLEHKDGLLSVMFDPHTRKPNGVGAGVMTLGALGDSFYEYLLKQWILSNFTEVRSHNLYMRAVNGIVEHMVFQSRPSYFTYVSELKNGKPTHIMEHLACFTPGMLMLGASLHANPGINGNGNGNGNDTTLVSHRVLATQLADTCAHLATSSKSGLAPDSVKFWLVGGRDSPDFEIVKANYMLRPEIIESLFYLHRFTHDPKYRKIAWKMFQSIEKHCKTAAAYSGVTDVRRVPVAHDNSMQSFFLAETLKYFWLIFSDDDALNLNEFVFNTEGHPLRISTPPQWKKTDSDS